MENCQHTLQSYSLALLTLMGNQDADKENPPLGWAFCWERQSSIYNLANHSLLRALIENPPSPEADQEVARQFMTALKKCKNSNVINLVDTLDSGCSVSPGDWAVAVQEEIKQNGGNLKPLMSLAELYLNALVIPLRSPTSSEFLYARSTDRDNNTLLELAMVHCNQAALKELVLRRDGPHCLITGYTFVGKGKVFSECMYIIPFSVYNKTAVHVAIEMFTGGKVRAAEVQHLINNPINAIVMQCDPLISMDQDLAWGIEVRSVNNKQKYYFHIVRPNKIPEDIQLNDGDEIEFGKGSNGNMIELPDPRLCNLHLAIARVFMTSGFAEVVDKITEDWGDNESGEIEVVDEVWCRYVLGV